MRRDMTGEELLALFPHVMGVKELDEIIIDDLCSELGCSSLGELARSFVIDDDLLEMIAYNYGGSVAAAIRRTINV